MALASVSLDTARELLNDVGATIWPNTVLIPFFNIGYRMLQTKLKNAGCPVQMSEDTNNIAANTTVPFTPTNIIEPIRLWEKTQAASDLTYIQMTEKAFLPTIVTTTNLRVWRWNGTSIEIIGATVNKTVKTRMWSFVADITTAGDDIPFVNAENYLGPITASLANESIGEHDQSAKYQEMADVSLTEIIASNRGISMKVRP